MSNVYVHFSQISFLHDIQLSIFDWDLNHWDSEKLFVLKLELTFNNILYLLVKSFNKQIITKIFKNLATILAF